MTPSEYVEHIRCDEEVLTKSQAAEAREVLDSGFRLIAKRIGIEHEQVNPDAIKSIEALAIMLIVFVQHAFNPEMLRRVVAEANG